MIRGGQRPVPTEVHKQRGTYNATRHGRDRAGEPKPLDDLGEAPPAGLTASQRAEWRHQVQHFPPGVIKASDRRWLLIWVKAGERPGWAPSGPAGAAPRTAVCQPELPLGMLRASCRRPRIGQVEGGTASLARCREGRLIGWWTHGRIPTRTEWWILEVS